MCNCKHLYSYENQKRIALIQQTDEQKDIIIYRTGERFGYCFDAVYIPKYAELYEKIDMKKLI